MNIPEGFLRQMQGLLGDEEFRSFEQAMEGAPSVAIRLNPAKPTELREALKGEPVEWCARSARLAERPAFTLMPELHAGAFYVQDPSSMVVAEVVARLCREINRPVAALDACAAPGGKTTAMLDALPQGSMVVANEFDPHRAGVLVENLTKWGTPNVMVTTGDTSRYSSLRSAFDIILIDAPCSGEGMMRKDETARSQWSPGLVKQCAALQSEIIDNLWSALRPGGYLIYSTCTFNLAEDEEQVARIIDTYGAENVDLQLSREWGIGHSLVDGIHALRFMPHLTQGEGLFLSVLRKPEAGEYTAPARPAKKKKQQRAPKAPEQLGAFLNEPETFAWVSPADGVWCAVPAAWQQLYERVSKECRVLKSGTELCTVKGKDLIPAHALALSTALSRDAFLTVELSEQDSLTYLRREPLLIPDAPRGYLLATYKGLPLGFLKNLGNRTNNLYPAPWRIRMKS